MSPSLSSSSLFDKNLKTRLICDTLTLVGLKPYDKQKFKQEQEKISAKRRMNGLAKNNQFYDSKSVSLYSNYNGDPEVLNEFIEQGARTGDFERIFPLDLNVEYYSQFFERERANNEMIRKYLNN